MLTTFLCADDNSNSWLTWVFVGVLVVLVAALLIVPMFTNKKRAKEESERNNSLHPGDVIETIGGIIGTILEIRQVSPTEKELVIETGVGDNKTTMRLDIRALATVVTRAAAETTGAEQQVANAVAAEQTESISQPASEEIPAVAPETPVSEAAVETEKSEAVQATEDVTHADTAAEQVATNATEETAAVAEDQAEPAPVKKTTTKRAPAKSAGKSNSAGKSTSRKPAAKKSADTDKE